MRILGGNDGLAFFGGWCGIFTEPAAIYADERGRSRVAAQGMGGHGEAVGFKPHHDWRGWLGDDGAGQYQSFSGGSRLPGHRGMRSGCEASTDGSGHDQSALRKPGLQGVSRLSRDAGSRGHGRSDDRGAGPVACPDCDGSCATEEGYLWRETVGAHCRRTAGDCQSRAAE